MKPELAEAEASILHEMGAMLTSVQGFSDMLERSPEHPDRARFVSLVASESRRAVGALRDLQLVRALAQDDIRQDLAEVELEEVASEAEIDGAGNLSGVSVEADRHLLAELLSRCAAVAHGGAWVGEPADGKLVITFPLAGEGIAHELSSWRERLRPVGLALHVLPRWGLETELEDDLEPRFVVSVPAPRRS